MELTKVKLSDVARVEISGVDKKSKPGQKSVRLCNFVDVYHNWAITQDMRDSFMEATASDKEIEALSIKKGQVAFTKDSETRDDIGIPTYIADDFDDVVLGYHNALITPDERKLNGKYLNAFMHSSYIQKYFENNASGSGQRYTLSNDTVNSIPILLPTIKEQEKIGNLFSFIDRKIALNKKMNQKLEAMAKRLYDYWFVQYDFPDKNGLPYKTTGGPMTYNPTLKREIPVGWEVDNLYAVADYINGLACQNKRPKSGENALPVIKIREMSEGITSDTEEVSENIPLKYIVENGDILFSWSATLMVMIWAGGKGGLNQHIFKVVPKAGFPKEFVYQLLSDYVVNFQQIALSRKTTMGHITSDHINLSRVVLPPENVLKRYAEKVCPIFDKVVRNQVEYRKLTTLRDKLLPLLMNGQVIVD